MQSSNPVVDLSTSIATQSSMSSKRKSCSTTPKWRSYAESEIKAGRERLTALESELQKLLLPKDPTMSAIFFSRSAQEQAETSRRSSGDLFRMYSRYSERQGWQVEVMSESPGDAADTRRSSRALSARAPTPSSNSSRGPRRPSAEVFDAKIRGFSIRHRLRSPRAVRLRAGRCVDAALGLGGRNSLDAMAPRLEFELGVGAPGR